jgi:hypothetical protein
MTFVAAAPARAISALRLDLAPVEHAAGNGQQAAARVREMVRA